MKDMLIKASDLTKKYGSKIALDKVSFEINEGQLVAYLGTNGVGKSTTINILTGLLKPTSGTIEYHNNLRIGIVFQNSVLDRDLTVADNLNLRAKMYQQYSKDWLEELIDLIGIRSFLSQKYGTLSGGQKRRVDIARALISQPNLLFLDEPTTGLDLQTRLGIWELLEMLRQKQGLTIFLTTHYLEEAKNADQIYILENGKILAKGSAERIKKEYAPTKFVVRINGKNQIFRGWNSSKVIHFLENNEVQDFEYRKGSLDDAFIKITGKKMG